MIKMEKLKQIFQHVKQHCWNNSKNVGILDSLIMCNGDLKQNLELDLKMENEDQLRENL